MKALRRDLFYAGARPILGRLEQDQVDGINVLLDALEADGDMADLRWCAYALATVKLECDNQWRPIIEKGPRHYFDKYEPPTPKARELGNLTLGDGFKYRGRGYVQITGLANYRRFTDALNVDLIDKPDLALEPVTAYRIMSLGMRRGMFTGKGLPAYFAAQTDWLNARRIINAMNRATEIARNAQAFHEVLLAA